jgi:hypothetical protein
MANAAQVLAHSMTKIQFKFPTVDVISNVTGMPVSDFQLFSFIMQQKSLFF